MQERLLKLVTVELGNKGDMLIWLISRWGKVVVQVSSIEGLVAEIERLDPDAVVVDMDLYDRIGGIETLNLIRDGLNVNAWFE